MCPEDPLADEPFAYRATKSGLVQVSCRGKVVKTLRGPEAARFLARVEGADGRTAQLAMAKVTGQFKFGNERHGK
ncbi:MAG: hypothetical protein HKN12_04590 [Gemmatimonadetes bacterium]|nr:hypothetical protein [Gemmatimonadota bacterium]